MNSRLLLATLLAVSMLALAGCATTENYSVSISEPTNGTVIQNIAFDDINERDGARYELEYQLENSTDENYTIQTYEQKNGSYEVHSSTALTGHESSYKNDFPPPWDPGAERTYKLTVIQTDTDTVIDEVTITLKRDER